MIFTLKPTMYRIILLQLIVTLTVAGHRNKTRYACTDDWPKYINETGNCSFTVSPESVTSFSKNIRHNGYNFVLINLQFGNVSVRWTRCVIEAKKWVWTFDGINGATAYLNWPIEYSLLSFGLLDSHTLRKQPIEIISHGDCDVMIGHPSTTYGIAHALANMTGVLIRDSKDSMKYDGSVWCYKERFFVNHEKWLMCKYVLCPFESIAYRCCKWNNYKPGEKHGISCEPNKKEVKWCLPFVLGSVVYLYSPILVFGVVGFLYSKCDTKKRETLKIGRGVSVEYGTFPSVAYTYLPEPQQPDFDLDIDESIIFYNYIQFSSIFECFRSQFCCVPVRCFRCLFVVGCLSILMLKLLIYNSMEREFIVESVRQNIPMGFLSILTKFEKQRYNYMTCTYGPVPALVLFVCFSLLFLCIPHDLGLFLTKRLTENAKGISISPLTSDISIKMKFGSLKSIRNVNGYKKMKMMMVSHILMLLNIQFWRYCLVIEISRWKSLLKRNTGPVYVLVVLFFPLYCLLCILELLLCIVYFGIPILFLYLTCIKAYCGAVMSFCAYRMFLIRICRPILTAFVFIILMTLLYLFSIIFIDSVIFISQIVTYTYTGLFANPDFSYGYVILAITVTMYVFDSVNGMHSVYDDLFIHVRDVCQKLTKEEKYPEIQLIHTVDEFHGIPRKLFSYVIQTTRPIRKEIFVSILKIVLIASILSVSVAVLSDFQDFKRMSDLMQAAVTLFVCLVPKIINSVCQVNKTKWQIQRSLELKNAVHYFCRREMRKRRENSHRMTIIN